MDSRRWGGTTGGTDPEAEKEAFYQKVEDVEHFLRRRAEFLAGEWPEGWDGTLADGA